MTSRERVRKAINHILTDRVPVDLGAFGATGISAYTLMKLRKALGLEQRRVKVFEPFMFLGEVDDDIRKALGCDAVGLYDPYALPGYRNTDWRAWKTPRGMEVLVGKGFTVSYGQNGTVYMHPKENINAPPCGIMLHEGLYFEHTVRQDELSEHTFNAREDYADQYTLYTEEVLRYLQESAQSLYTNTEYSIFGNFGTASIGDAFHIPGPWLEHPRGIRDPEEWLMAPLLHPRYVHDFFSMQTETALRNLELYHEAVGDRIDVISLSGTDFGGQNGPLVSPDIYREFYKPYHKMVAEWIHCHTGWKVFAHSCGSITAFLPDFIEAGIDIINPVQISAYDMDPASLKARFGDRIVFWGGGVDPQHTIRFGTPEEVAAETRLNVKILSQGGGFVCAHVHNIQPGVPIENVLAFFGAING